MNFAQVAGPYGGTHSFLRTLRDWLLAKGVEITHDLTARCDVALLSGLTDGVNLASVRAIAARGIPIVHRKVGYRVSGSHEMRKMVDGVVHGDRLQVEFTPYLAHTVFQSRYSRDVFTGSGFDGPSTVIHNGVDETVFNTRVTHGWFGRREGVREWWNGRDPMQVVVSTWSADPNKGFEEYGKIDRQLTAGGPVRVSLVGRTPPDVRFRHIRVRRPRARQQLARLLKRAHVLLQLANFETCSNALIEGINCGLPVIYLDSGSNSEIAAPYGIAYTGDWAKVLSAIRERYDALAAATTSNPFRISVVGPQYLQVLKGVC